MPLIIQLVYLLQYSSRQELDLFVQYSTPMQHLNPFNPLEFRNIDCLPKSFNIAYSVSNICQSDFTKCCGWSSEAVCSEECVNERCKAQHYNELNAPLQTPTVEILLYTTQVNSCDRKWLVSSASNNLNSKSSQNVTLKHLNGLYSKDALTMKDMYLTTFFFSRPESRIKLLSIFKCV